MYVYMYVYTLKRLSFRTPAVENPFQSGLPSFIFVLDNLDISLILQ